VAHVLLRDREAGAIAVCIAAAYKRDEMTRVVNDSLSSVVITCEELLPHLPDRSIIPHVRDIVVMSATRS